MADEEPKIIIDSDWKDEAQKEKERLVEEEQTAGDDPAAGRAARHTHHSQAGVDSLGVWRNY